MNEVILQSFGGTQTVTGSKHLLKTPELNILIDCGLFQGGGLLHEQNRLPLKISVSEIDVIILTHAHLDHCGYIPLLVKKGFKGLIYMTQPTSELTELILIDSAKLQEEEAESAIRHPHNKQHLARPLYTKEDAIASLWHFKAVSCNVFISLSNHIRFRFKTCGHILGACSVELTCFERTIIFSGDIGRPQSTLLPAPDYFTSADYVIMESTYGDRIHGDNNACDELEKVINQTIAQRGNILIPTFAVGRAQELIYILNLLKKERKIPLNLPVIMDSPMAAAATRIFMHYADDYMTISSEEFLEMNNNIIINEDYNCTMDYIKEKRSKIVIAGSGMITGGRVLEYLKYYIGDSRNTVLIMGFQAEGTIGRALLNQSHEVNIQGKYYIAKARILEIKGLSAYADQTELLSWIRKFERRPKEILLIHGEPCAQKALGVKIQTELNLPVKIIKQNQDVLLFNSGLTAI